MAHPYQGCKIVKITPPAAIVDNSAITTTEVDTKGYDYAQFFLHLGATDIAMTVCKLQESATSGSGMADFDSMDMDGDTDIDGNAATLPTATDDDKFWRWDVDLRGRQRYMDLSLTMGDGTAGGFAVAWVVLWRGNNTPTTSAECGCENILRSP